MNCLKCGHPEEFKAHQNPDEVQEKFGDKVVGVVLFFGGFHDFVPNPAEVCLKDMMTVLRDFSELKDDSPANLGRLKYEAGLLLERAGVLGLDTL